ncbi:MAG: hypothetical protein HYZ14_01180 [Bacteroidetes bacterium]|nr:hypothetical protein [Bacteroidota bacterium]
MTNKLVRANIQRYSTHSFDEYGDPNPVYNLQVNGKKLTLKTRDKKLPSGINFSQKFEFIFEINTANEVIAFSSPLQDLKWGNQTHIETLTGSKKPKLIYQFVSGTVAGKQSRSETVNTHLPRFGMQNKTLEKRTTYFINISGQNLAGSSSYRKIKVGDQVTGVTNQYGYLEMLKNTHTGKIYGLFSIWPMVIALVVMVLINIVFLTDGSMNEPVKTAFGEFPKYYEKFVFFNLVAIPVSIMTIFWTKKRFMILRFHNQNNK